MSRCATMSMPMPGYTRSGRHWRPFETLAMVLGFIVFWPIGLAILAWKIIGRGRMPRRFEERMAGWSAGRWNAPDAEVLHRDSGNAAFEDYKSGELARLEEERRRLAEEQRAFGDFLDELKRAKDREEFDRFMARRARNMPQAG